MLHSKKHQIIVIGAGHAGCEAILASARRGFDSLLITGNIDMIGAMSCNPAIGGLGKGHLVKEIDALGGEMGKNIDETGIQFRRLNANRGPAVQGTRAQADKYLYRDRMRWIIEMQKNLTVKQGLVKSILVEAGQVKGVELTSGDQFLCDAVVVTTGTFLRGLCHVGLKNFSGGRAGDAAAMDLSHSLMHDCGLELMRLKTGTVPRLDGKTINFTGLEEQHGDDPTPLFSFSKTFTRQRQISCHITYTNETTHELIRADLDKSPMFQGIIKGVGPRYCPSIEDKVVRFAEKDRHQIFLEPEGLRTREYYPNGLSTSLPLETQIKFIRSIPGLENAEITRPGYAVEYDAASPVQLKSSLETKTIRGLFLAGQINGTSGYEEAGAQGLMAGLNAGQLVRGEEPIVLSRDQAYIGVMIDDLVTKGVGGEPYRMFTSRAEYRMVLREDNADVRLRDLGFRLGLVTEQEYRAHQEKMANLESLKNFVQKKRLVKNSPILKKLFEEIGKEFPEILSVEQLMKWPEIELPQLKSHWLNLESEIEFDHNLISLLLSEVKYKGYIDRYSREIKKMASYDKVKIPTAIQYELIPTLSTEVKQRLTQHRPETLGQALRIPGVTPVAVSHLEIFIATNRSTT
jgi:tRNA uridine 5-carboxymethylaminomethyl modification enzyme